MPKVLWVALPLMLAAAVLAVQVLRGRAPSRHAINVGASVLLLVYVAATAGLGIFWVANQQLPAFDVWSLAVTYDVTKRMQAYLRAENLFNEKYEEITSGGTPIRSIFGGLRFTFGGNA